jgi:uncharacterized protein YdaU (DUF1376 family)
MNAGATSQLSLWGALPLRTEERRQVSQTTPAPREQEQDAVIVPSCFAEEQQDDMNYYEHHLGDYLKDTAHLSVIEDGIYLRLLHQYYILEAPLPRDRLACAKLARARSKAELSAVDYVLDTFFALHDDGYHQSRADREIVEYRKKQEQRKDASAKAVAARTRKPFNPDDDPSPSAPPSGSPNGSPTDAPSGSLRARVPSPQSPVPSPQKEKERESARAAKRSRQCPADFVVTPELKTWAVENVPRVDVDAETEKFRDWEFKDPKSDWTKAWRNWMRKAPEFVASSNGRSGGHPEHLTFAERDSATKAKRFAEMAGRRVADPNVIDMVQSEPHALAGPKEGNRP